MKAAVSLIAAGLLAVASSATLPQEPVALPSYVKTCQRDQPDFDSCILSSLQQLLPYLVKGIPELDLPAIDPHVLDEFVTEYANGHVEAKMVMKNVVTHGLSGLQFLDVRTNFENENDMVIQMDIFVPRVKMEGKYKFHGKFLGSDMGSKGNFEVTLANVSTTFDIHGALQTLSGNRYLKVTEFGMEPEIGDLKVYASDLFNGNEELTKIALELFNQNWRRVYAEIMPYIRQSRDKRMKGFANQVFLKVPFDKLFPVST